MSWRKFFGTVGLVCLGAVPGVFPGFLLEAFAGHQQIYHGRYLEERRLMEPVIANDPAFADVTIHERSDGGIDLSGEVPTRADQQRLREQFMRALGESAPTNRCPWRYG